MYVHVWSILSSKVMILSLTRQCGHVVRYNKFNRSIFTFKKKKERMFLRKKSLCMGLDTLHSSSSVFHCRHLAAIEGSTFKKKATGDVTGIRILMCQVS